MTIPMTLYAKKSLGQHFLNSKHVLEQIISAAHMQKGESVLEIGPGTGILTEALLTAGAEVVTIEKDDRAIDILKAKFSSEISAGQLNLIHGDALDEQSFNLSIFNGPYSLIANIPYYITGAILEKFLEYAPRPTRMVLLVQKEVAERIIARDGKESVLSISVKAFGTPKIIAMVPPGAFTPPPTVDSAILSIQYISADRFHAGEDNRAQIKRFFEIVKAGFAHKRKFLIRNLETVIDPTKLREIWTTLHLNEKVRAEDLRLEDWIRISAN